nr:hypothetical protein CFP56_57878 [Quercus suber]
MIDVQMYRDSRECCSCKHLQARLPTDEADLVANHAVDSYRIKHTEQSLMKNSNFLLCQQPVGGLHSTTASWIGRTVVVKMRSALGEATRRDRARRRARGGARECVTCIADLQTNSDIESTRRFTLLSQSPCEIPSSHVL